MIYISTIISKHEKRKGRAQERILLIALIMTNKIADMLWIR